MPIDPHAGVISHAIQLAVAPVFLLSGIAALLNVMTTRLSRVIDRARAFEQAWSALDDKGRTAARGQIRILERRRRLCSWSITFATAAALFVCLVIVALFTDEFFVISVNWVAAALFVAAMVAVILSLSCFLSEVYVATHTTAIDHKRFE